jgi:hypothetical protein
VREIAWLIRNKGFWFTVYLGDMIFVADVESALRFSREQDADDMIDHKFFNDYPEALVVQKEFR